MLDKLISIMGGNLVGGIKDLIQTFKLPPEQQIQFEQKMAELEANTRRDMEKIAAEDRDSARKREMALPNDHTTQRLAYMSVIGFFGVLAAQFYFAFEHKIINVEIQRTLDITTGILFAMVLAVKDYYFGSSSSSAQKTKLLGEK